ncbi:hypothetical protein K7432_003185 [Basidiobolus ranarum]|uniref:Uncharacterized protein n=1 Tax=Basidiobolus ranarum TaxID=34480 RepID=A0ABR2X0H7_9FUNG
MKAALILISVVASLHAVSGAPGLYSDGYDYCQAPKPSKAGYKPMPNARLAHVQLVVRHGDRAPVYPLVIENDVSWDCDEVKEISRLTGNYKRTKYDSGDFEYKVMIPEKNALSQNFWNGTCLNGQLTSKGKLQHMELGNTLRQIYVEKMKYLPKKLKDPNMIYVRSSDVGRTRQSAQSVVTGLYPVKDRHIHGSGIPIYFEPNEIETIKFNKGICPRFVQIAEAMIKTPYYQNYYKSAQPLKKQLDEILAPESLHWPDNTMVAYMDSMRTRLCHNKPLPCKNGKCVTKKMTDQLFRFIDQEYTYTHRDAKLADQGNAVILGWFFRDIQERMVKASKNRHSSPPLEIFSGHDDTVQGLLGLMRSKDMRWPPLASNILFELWEKKDRSYHVRVLFNGKVLKVQNEWCNMNSCPLNRFIKFFASKLPTDKNQCQANLEISN